MRTKRTICLMLGYMLVSSLVAGCSSISLPPAKGYEVMAGNVGYFAKSVKIHGSWVEMQTDQGPVWANGVVITPKN